MFIITIIVTNLLTGLAVDDIDKIRKNAESKRLCMLIEATLLQEFELPNFWVFRSIKESGCVKFKKLADLERYANQHNSLGPLLRFFRQDRHIPVSRIEAAADNPLWVPEQDEDLDDLYS